MNSSKLKTCCQLCECQKPKKRREFLDNIEKTTQCSLSTETGTVLKIRQTEKTVDEAATWKKKSCQCGAPSVDVSPAPSKNETLEKPPEFNPKPKFNCKEQIRGSRPKWLYQFTDQQEMLLEGLYWALIDDNHEGTDYRVRSTLFRLGLHPQPSRKQVEKAAEFNRANPVLFLNELLTILQESGKDFSHNHNILMNGIVYFELPFLLYSVVKNLPKRTEIFDGNYVKKDAKTRCADRRCLDPYMEPIWPRNFKNWQEQRKRDSVVKIEFIKKKRIGLPEEISRGSFFCHIRPEPERVPSPVLEVVSEEENEDEECVVVQMRREWLPDDPEKETRKKKVRVASIAEEEEPKEKDFEEILKDTLSELADRGVISAAYPDIDRHPVLIHLAKFAREELITRGAKQSLVDKSATVKPCIKIWYSLPKMDQGDNCAHDKTWAFIKHLREIAKKRKGHFLDQLWEKRMQCGQNVWNLMFSPEYPQVRSFLPVFSAYATSYRTDENFWLIKQKEG